MPKLNFTLEYEESASAPYIDWVAGGNFNGYLIKKSLKFIDSNYEVLIKHTIIDDSKYDGQANNFESIAIFEYSDKETITIKCDQFEMRGKILGKNNEYIAFTVLNLKNRTTSSEVYKIKNV